MSPLFAIFGVGQTELLVVAGVALLLFGHRLPSVMRSLGRGVVEFKKGVSGVDEEGSDDDSGTDDTSASDKVAFSDQEKEKKKKSHVS